MLLLCSALLIAQAPSASATVRDVRCGSYCLFVAAEAFHRAPSSFADLEKMLGDPGTGGYSIRQLEVAARGLGLATIAVETNLERLKARPEPFACIALLRGSHYVLIYDIDDVNALYIDPPARGSFPIDTFRHNWDGAALLVGPDPFIPEEAIRLPIRWSVVLAIAAGVLLSVLLIVFGMKAVRARRGGLLAALVISSSAMLSLSVGCSESPPAPARHSFRVVPPAHEFGPRSTIATGGEITAETAIENDGSIPLKILALRPSCSCLGISIDRTEIPPGSRAILKTRVALGDESGVRRTTVLVDTSDAERSTFELPFTWEAVPPLVAEPGAISARGLRPGEEFATDLAISAREIGLCPRCQVRAQADSSAIRCEFAAKPIDGGSRIDGHDGEAESGPLGTLRVRIEGSQEPCDYRRQVMVRVVCEGKDRARLEVPASWSVQPVIELSPSRLWLGLRSPGERVGMRMMLRSTAGSPFLIRELACDAPEVLVRSEKRDAAAAVQPLALEFRIPDASGPWRSSITLTTDLDGAG